MNPITLPLVTVSAAGEVSLVHGGRPREFIRAAILELKDQLMALTAEHRETPVEHEFCDGMYIRRMRIPKDTLIVGKIHRLPCINVLQSGDLSVLTEVGSSRLGPGFMARSPAGMQKLGFAHQESVFVNIFRTDELDIETIEKQIACESYDLVNVNGALTCQ